MKPEVQEMQLLQFSLWTVLGEHPPSPPPPQGYELVDLRLFWVLQSPDQGEQGMGWGLGDFPEFFYLT